MKIVSQSSLKKKAYCNYLQYEYEVEGNEPSLPFERGSIIHEMLENLDKDGNILKYSKEESEYKGIRRPYKHFHDFELYEKLVKNFYNDHKELFQKGIAELEMSTKLIPDEVVLSGIIDRVLEDGDKATLIDWKTGSVEKWVIDPHSNLNFTDKILNTLQAKVYSLLYFRNNPHIMFIDFVWYYIEMGKKTTISFTRDDVKTLYNEIMHIYLLSINKGFSPSNQCKKCTKFIKCPFFKKLGDFPFAITVDGDLTDVTEEELYKKKKKVDMMYTNLGTLKETIKSKLLDKVEDTGNAEQYFNNSVKHYIKIDKNVPTELLVELLGTEKSIAKAKLVEMQLKYPNVKIIKKESKRWKTKKKEKK